MLVAFLATLAALIGVLALFARRERDHARDLIRLGERHDRLREARENQLWDRLAHAHDKPWEEPPEPAAVVADEDAEPEEDFVFDLSHVDDSVVPAGASF